MAANRQSHRQLLPASKPRIRVRPKDLPSRIEGRANQRSQLVLAWSGKDSEPTAVIGNVRLVDGPLTQTLLSSAFDGVRTSLVVFCVADTLADVERLESALRRRGLGIELHPMHVPLDDPTDYAALRQHLRRALHELQERFPPVDWEWQVLLNSGTPQMRTTWLVLAAQGQLDAKLLHSTPAEVAREFDVPLLQEIDAREALAWREAPMLSQAADTSPSRVPAFACDQSAPASGVSVSESEQLRGLQPLEGSSRAVRLLRTQIHRAAQKPGSFVLQGEVGCGQQACAAAVFHERFGVDFRINLVRLDELDALDPIERWLKRDEAELRQLGEGVLVCADPKLPADLAVLLRRYADRPLALGVSLPPFSQFATSEQEDAALADPVALPTLRARAADLQLHIKRLASGLGVEVSGPALRLLCAWSWPGNFPELRRTIKMLAAQAQSGVISEGDIPPALREVEHAGLSLSKRIEQVEELSILQALDAHGGNRSAAARALGISRTTLLSRLRRLEAALGQELG